MDRYLTNNVVLHFQKTKHKVAPKVYWFLYVSLSTDPSPSPIRVKLRDIASYLNINRYSVSRSLRILRNMGLIRYHRSKHGIVVTHVASSL